MNHMPAQSRPSQALIQQMGAIAKRAKAAARILANVSPETKNQALSAMAKALSAAAPSILRANAKDLKVAEREKKNAAFLDRLLLNAQRIAGMAKALQEIVALPDPVGERTEHWTRPNG